MSFRAAIDLARLMLAISAFSRLEAVVPPVHLRILVDGTRRRLQDLIALFID